MKHFKVSSLMTAIVVVCLVTLPALADSQAQRNPGDAEPPPKARPAERTAPGAAEPGKGQPTKVEPTQGESTKVESTDEESTDGESTDGESTDGESTDGESTDGESTDGESADGEPAAAEASPAPLGPSPVAVDAPASAPVRESKPTTAAEPDAKAAARELELAQAIQAELAQPGLLEARVSLLVAPADGGRPLFELWPDAARVPASNAKLFTTAVAASSLPGNYRFITRVWRGRAGAIYLSGTGDPLLGRADLRRLALAVRARGVRSVRGIVVDDSYLGRRRLAPGFESFSAGSRYRPTQGALNVDGNAVLVKISAQRGRRIPRVDVFPPSDYVKVRKLVRFARRRSDRRPVRVQISQVGSKMWLTVTGRMARRSRPIVTRRAVYDPAFNAGWAFRRALVEAGVSVVGGVRRGRRPVRGKVLAYRERALSEVLRATNQRSDNLAAETLARAMAFVPGASPRGAAGGWASGLALLHRKLAAWGVQGVRLGNGSGLHRSSRVTARAVVALLQRIHRTEDLKERLLPTLAVAGRVGTLGRRLRGTAAEGLVHAKTGTLGGVLALSGYVDPAGSKPLAFSMLVNGRSDRAARAQIDRVAVLLARYARGLPLSTCDDAEACPPAPEVAGNKSAKAAPVPTPTGRASSL